MAQSEHVGLSDVYPTFYGFTTPGWSSSVGVPRKAHTAAWCVAIHEVAFSPAQIAPLTSPASLETLFLKLGHLPIKIFPDTPGAYQKISNTPPCL